jgi:hypothetical protein
MAKSGVPYFRILDFTGAKFVLIARNRRFDIMYCQIAIEDFVIFVAFLENMNFK